ncbi:hypothetical protein VE03_02738 [Pseudogymnoascus sp. 23342-1-I1]|nr:hypothetical protein VE03_02738 [Pseudogymnoascus sp. 23342-1-I1]
MPCVPNNAATFLCDGLAAGGPAQATGAPGPHTASLIGSDGTPTVGMSRRWLDGQLISALDAEAPLVTRSDITKVGVFLILENGLGIQVGHWKEANQRSVFTKLVGYYSSW